MAIDGVAPRAKINQQRSRRFRSAKEAVEMHDRQEKARREWIKAGRKAPPKRPPAWDSNVITPGTPFMDKLARDMNMRFIVHAMLMLPFLFRMATNLKSHLN